MGKLFGQLLKFAAKNKDVARDALVSGGLNTGLSLTCSKETAP
jgi:hypothetical protein